jgi:hypothetical protein
MHRARYDQCTYRLSPTYALYMPLLRSCLLRGEPLGDAVDALYTRRSPNQRDHRGCPSRRGGVQDKHTIAGNALRYYERDHTASIPRVHAFLSPKKCFSFPPAFCPIMSSPITNAKRGWRDMAFFHGNILSKDGTLVARDERFGLIFFVEAIQVAVMEVLRCL